MKLYEVISFNRELLRRLSSVGIRLDDCKYIDLYEDYRKLREGGDRRKVRHHRAARRIRTGKGREAAARGVEGLFARVAYVAVG